jgi:hypothetical protein
MKLTRTLIILALIIFAQNSNGQQISENKRSLFFDAEYFFESEDYREALANYLKLYTGNVQKNCFLNYKIGICYLNIEGSKDLAIPYLEKATENVTNAFLKSSINETRAPFDTYLFLGDAYRASGDVNKAILAYWKFKNTAGDVSPNLLPYTERQIESCKTAKELIEKPIKVTYEDLSANIPEAKNVLSMCISPNEQVIAFAVRSKFYDAVYVAQKVDGKWGKATNVTPFLKSDGNQYPCGLSHNGDTLFLNFRDPYDSDIFYSTIGANKKWTAAEPFIKAVNTKNMENGLAITSNNKQLFFASSKKGSLGQKDIFTSIADAKNAFKTTTPLSNIINTPFDEDLPSLSKNDSILFFYSQGNTNMGGYDLFYTTKDKSGNWTKPINVGYPINSTDDDLLTIPVGDNNVFYAYYYKKGNWGEPGLYKVILVP